MRLKERRESLRVNYLCECQIESKGLSAKRVTARINDLSPEGAFIDSMSWLPIGSKICMKFKIQEIEIQASADVRYFMRDVGMGVRFLDLTGRDRQLIESAISQTPLPNYVALPQPTAAPALTAAAAMAELTRLDVSEPDKTATDGADASCPVMAGDLTVLNLFDVIDVIENSRLTGSVTVQAVGLDSEIQFNDGVIVGASDGTAVGIGAFNRILGSPGETFEFRESPSRFAETIQSSGNTSLILEMLIHKDEEAPARPA